MSDTTRAEQLRELEGMIAEYSNEAGFLGPDGVELLFVDIAADLRLIAKQARQIEELQRGKARWVTGSMAMATKVVELEKQIDAALEVLNSPMLCGGGGDAIRVVRRAIAELAPVDSTSDSTTEGGGTRSGATHGSGTTVSGSEP